jgi:hypothetical protein
MLTTRVLETYGDDSDDKDDTDNSRDSDSNDSTKFLTWLVSDQLTTCEWGQRTNSLLTSHFPLVPRLQIHNTIYIRG